VKAASVALVIAAQVLALSLWFSGTAAGPGMLREAATAAGPGFQALLSSAVQGGFVIGSLASAVLGLADRHDPRRVFAGAAVLGAAANSALLLLPIGAGDIAARFLTGAALAGIYPVGMKLAVGWADRDDAGLLVGLLVGGLTVGSASPHLLNALGGLDWRVTLGGSSVAALAAPGWWGWCGSVPGTPRRRHSGRRPGWTFGVTAACGWRPSATSGTCGSCMPCGPGSDFIWPPVSRRGRAACWRRGWAGKRPSPPSP
jgi:hypothetical protein